MKKTSLTNIFVLKIRNFIVVSYQKYCVMSETIHDRLMQIIKQEEMSVAAFERA